VDEAQVFTFVDQPVKINRGPDGYYWKRVFRTGNWIEGPSGGPMKIDEQFIDNVVAAYEAAIWPHVTVPLSHSNAPEENSGYIRSLKKETVEVPEGETVHYLTGAFEFLDREVEMKVASGLIADVSCGLFLNYKDSQTGKVWPVVLWHVALTNEPFVSGLGDWTNGIAAARVSDKAYVFNETGRNAAVTTTGEQTPPPDAITLEAFNAERQRADDLARRLALLESQTVEQRIDARLAPFSGKLPPVVLARAKELMGADSGATALTFSREENQLTMTVSDAIIDVLSSVPAVEVLQAGGDTAEGSATAGRPPEQPEGQRMSAEQVTQTADSIIAQLGRGRRSGAAQ
jgi:hypothetical protein